VLGLGLGLGLGLCTPVHSIHGQADKRARAVGSGQRCYVMLLLCYVIVMLCYVMLQADKRARGSGQWAALCTRYVMLCYGAPSTPVSAVFASR
jgi:hypothetical protein